MAERGYSEEQWRAACDRAVEVPRCHDWLKCPTSVFVQDGAGVQHEDGHPKYPPVGDPAAVLAMVNFVFSYNGETYVSVLTESTRLWSRTNNHTPDTVAGSFGAAIVLACAALPKEDV